MADYWKSNAKKYCEFCKCWIADNKPSVDFHERGKRHKENVALKLKNISRQSAKEHKEKRKWDEDFKKMEKAALEAYQKDMERNADYTSQLLNQQLLARSREIPSTSVDIRKEKMEHDGEKIVGIKKAKIAHDEKIVGIKKVTTEHSEKIVGIKTEKIEHEKTSKQWFEAVSNEGYTYYWNVVTGESVWDQPKEGYVSLQDQKENQVNQETEETFEEARKNEDGTRRRVEETKKEEEWAEREVEKAERVEEWTGGEVEKAKKVEEWTEREIEKDKRDEEWLCSEANRTRDVTRRNEELFKRATEEAKEKEEEWAYRKAKRKMEETKKKEEEWAYREAKREMEEARKMQEQMELRTEELRAFMEREKMKKFRGEESGSLMEKEKTKKFRGPESSYASSSFRPQGNPYGSWIHIERCVQKSIDLQLPEQGHVQNNIPEYVPTEPEIKFKEKNIHSIEGQGFGNENFKKRKFNGPKKNMRQRQNDDY